MLVGGIVLVLAGVLVIVVGELTASGRLGMNSIAGIRFGAMMASDEGWTAGHRAARSPIDLAGVMLAVTGLLLLFLPVSENAAGSIVLVGAGIALVLIVIATIVAQGAARRVLYRIASED
jgi:hypothetical protein